MQDLLLDHGERAGQRRAQAGQPITQPQPWLVILDLAGGLEGQKQHPPDPAILAAIRKRREAEEARLAKELADYRPPEPSKRKRFIRPLDEGGDW